MTPTERLRRSNPRLTRCACGQRTNVGSALCGTCRKNAQRQYNTPVPRKVRQDVSHGYGERLGRPAGDEYSNIAAMPMSEQVKCPRCGAVMERRRMNEHRKEIHR